MNLHLRGKRALVSGGMSTLGTSILKALAKEGVETVFTYADTAKAEIAREFCREISESHEVYCNALQIDLREQESVQKGITELASLFPHLDILIHNAGVFSVSSQQLLSEEEWDRIMDVNIKGMWRLVREGQPLLNEGGALVAVSSINAARPGFGGTAHYDAAKGAVSAYIRSLAAELGPKGIRVNGVAPGLLSSPSLEQENPELVQAYSERSFISSLVDPDSVASTIAFLASPAATSMTGEIVTIDGGYSLS